MNRTMLISELTEFINSNSTGVFPEGEDLDLGAAASEIEAFIGSLEDEDDSDTDEGA